MPKLRTVLLVDDDSINNYLNERLIKRLDIAEQVVVSVNGAEGVEFVKKHCIKGKPECPDLIFLDINMPVMDGFEFIRAFYKMDVYKPKIVILTTSSNPRDIEKLKELGEFEFINKPLTQDKLINFLAKASN